MTTLGDITEEIRVVYRSMRTWRNHSSDRFLVDALRDQLAAKLKTSKAIEAIRQELQESFGLAESQLHSEKLAGNVVKEEFWKGELSALHRIRIVLNTSLELDSAWQAEAERLLNGD